MTDGPAADRTPTDDRTTDIADRTAVHLGKGSAARDQESAGSAAPAPPPLHPHPPPRDDSTVDLHKHTLDAARAEAETMVGRPPAPVPSPYAPGPHSYGPPAYSAPPTGSPPYGAGPGSWPPPPGGPPRQPPPWPTATYPPQPGTPPLPPPAGRNNTTALVIFGVLAALVITGGVWALLLLAGGTSPFGGRDADDRPTAAPPTSDAPVLPPPSIAPLPPTGPPTAGADTGPSGQVQVSWTLDGTDYRAKLDTNGSGGTAEVTYPDSTTGGTATVVQDLTFVNSNGRQAFVGSSPRDPTTGAPSTSYLPDVFVLATNSEHGGVYVEQVCDLSGRCAPATMG